MPRPLKVLLHGTGTMGREHANALKDQPGVTIAGFVSRKKPRAAAMAKRYGGGAWTSLPDAIRQSRPDAVFVLTPTATHLADVTTAARAGLAVLCEKPIARTLKDAERLVRTVRTAKVPFMVGHVLRWFPQFRRLRDLARGGQLGAVSVIRLSRGGKYPAGSSGWYARGSGGPLLDLVIHDFDWLRWTFGDVDRVFAREAPPAKNAPPQAYALTLLRHRQGQMAHVEGRWGHDLPFRVTAELAGAKALASYDSLQPEVFAVHAPAAAKGLPAVAVPESPHATSPYRSQDLHFLECVRSGQDPMVSPEDAIAALSLSLAAIQSSRTGKAVRPA